jgi:hypothetical protein
MKNMSHICEKGKKNQEDVTGQILKVSNHVKSVLVEFVESGKSKSAASN